MDEYSIAFLIGMICFMAFSFVLAYICNRETDYIKKLKENIIHAIEPDLLGIDDIQEKALIGIIEYEYKNLRKSTQSSKEE